MTIETILFDFGGVLVEPLDIDEVCHRRNQLAHSLGFDHWQEMWNHFYTGDIWQAGKTGKMTHDHMWDALLSPFGLRDFAEQQAFTEQLFAGEGVQPTMRYLLDDLVGRYQLGILSNASDVLETVLDQFELTHYFDVIVNSHRIGVAKPDPAAFNIALQRLNANPDEVLFIDNLERNIKAAQSLGITSYLYTNISDLTDKLARQGFI